MISQNPLKMFIWMQKSIEFHLPHYEIQKSHYSNGDAATVTKLFHPFNLEKDLFNTIQEVPLHITRNRNKHTLY